MWIGIVIIRFSNIYALLTDMQIVCIWINTTGWFSIRTFSYGIYSIVIQIVEVEIHILNLKYWEIHLWKFLLAWNLIISNNICSLSFLCLHNFLPAYPHLICMAIFWQNQWNEVLHELSRHLSHQSSHTCRRKSQLVKYFHVLCQLFFSLTMNT